MKTLLSLLVLSSSAFAGTETGALVWKHHVVWGPSDLKSSIPAEREAYIERSSCNHIRPLPPQKVYNCDYCHWLKAHGKLD